MPSFKVGIKTAGDTNWGYNALRFPTASAAEAYALDLALRWTAVREWEVQPSDEAPNCGVYERAGRDGGV